MNLYDTVIRQYPVIFLTEIQDNCMPCYEQARKFSWEIADHIDILEDGKLMELAKYLDWEVFLKRIPSSKLSRLLILPDVPWIFISDKDYVPIEVLEYAMVYLTKESFSNTFQSLDVLEKYPLLMNWNFVSENYPLDHPIFRSNYYARYRLFWYWVVSSRVDLTESFLDEALKGPHRLNWRLISAIFLSRNQDLIHKYVEYVHWDDLEDLTIETIQKFSKNLKAYHVFDKREAYLSTEDAETILSIKDLEGKISVKRIQLDRDFIKRHRYGIDFGTLWGNKYVTKTLLISCLEYIKWTKLETFWSNGMCRERWVKSIYYPYRLFPFSVFILRKEMDEKIDWEGMQDRIDDVYANVTVNQIQKYKKSKVDDLASLILYSLRRLFSESSTTVKEMKNSDSLLSLYCLKRLFCESPRNATVNQIQKNKKKKSRANSRLSLPVYSLRRLFLDNY